MRAPETTITRPHLEADLIRGLLVVLLDGVGGGHCRRVDVAVVGDDEPVSAVVDLEPVEDRAARHDRPGQAGETGQVRGQELPDRLLEQKRTLH